MESFCRVPPSTKKREHQKNYSKSQESSKSSAEAESVDQFQCGWSGWHPEDQAFNPLPEFLKNSRILVQPMF